MSEGAEFEAPPAAELQMRFTQYRIEKLVAVGGMGAVYRATQLSVDRPVAFKILSSEYAENEQFRKRFGLEAKAMAKLNHPNIVQLYDYGESGDVIWMAQEWVSGQTVENMLDHEGAMDPSEAAAMVAQACEGLGYAHRQGIVHRDVKPANMMQDRDGNVKVMDFGLAHASHWEEPSLQSSEGARYATTEYAGPEIWDMEREPDHRADIFALGVLLFEALTGERPMDPFRSPSEMRPDLDPRYDGVIMRSMQTLPEDRYGSCAEFSEALREVVMTPPPPVPGQLMTGPVATGPLTGPLTGPITSPVTAPIAVTGAVPGVVPEQAVPVVSMQAARPALGVKSVQPASAKTSAILIWVATGLVVVALVIGACLMGSGNEEPEPPEETEKVETPRERAERLAREQAERLK